MLSHRQSLQVPKKCIVQFQLCSRNRNQLIDSIVKTLPTCNEELPLIKAMGFQCYLASATKTISFKNKKISPHLKGSSSYINKDLHFTKNSVSSGNKYNIVSHQPLEKRRDHFLVKSMRLLVRPKVQCRLMKRVVIQNSSIIRAKLKAKSYLQLMYNRIKEETLR